MSVLPRLGALPLAVSRDAAVSWKRSSHSWGLQCVFAGHTWTQIDGERSEGARLVLRTSLLTLSGVGME